MVQTNKIFINELNNHIYINLHNITYMLYIDLNVNEVTFLGHIWRVYNDIRLKN